MFTYYDKDNAPEASKTLMDQSVSMFGMLPNFHRVLAEAPATYEAHNTAYRLFTTSTGFSPLEAQIVYMSANYENKCHYCMAGHSRGMTMMKMPSDIIEAMREGQPLNDPKLEALRVFAKELLDHRGHIGDEKLNNFLAAGYSPRHALEVLCGLSAKLISNFTNALAHTTVEPVLEKFAWTHPDDRQES